MPVLAFDMTTANHESRRYEFRGKNNVDYYEGELKPLSSAEVDMKIEKSAAGEYGIYRLTSRTPLAFRRSWTHIRNDNTNVTIFWFVRRGQVVISHSDKRHEVNPGYCAITRSSKAFYMELLPDAGGQLEVKHVVVPSHKMYSMLHDNVDMGQPFLASRGDMYLAERILTLLFEQGDDISSDNAGHLVEALLNGLARTIEAIVGAPEPPPTISDRRVAAIRQCINQNFPSLDLNAKMVADSCGISLRYLCHVLRKNDLSFSRLVWERRMSAAEEWLADEKMQHNSIGVISYLAGFKSSAHFSRMFKARHGLAPREYRQQKLGLPG